MGIITVLTVILRCYSRHLIAKSFWWDDWTIVGAAVNLSALASAIKLLTSLQVFFIATIFAAILSNFSLNVPLPPTLTYSRLLVRVWEALLEHRA